MPASYQRSLFMAAIFPEAAALAEVLAAHDRQALMASNAAGHTSRLLHAARSALGCVNPPSCHDITHALTTWMHTRADMPPLQPVAVYPETGHHDDGTPCVTDGQRIAERLTIIHFRRDRRAPRIPRPKVPLPYAHRPAPRPDVGIRKAS